MNRPRPTALELRDRLKQGSLILGTLIVSTSPKWPEVIGNSDLDFVFIDTEHIPIDRSELSWMCRTYSALGVPPLVRIPSVDPFAATMALDGGADGIIAPYVETASQVQQMRGAVKKRPLKGARLKSHLEGQALEPQLDAYLKASGSEKLLIVNVESTPAMANLDEILSVPDLDSVLIGPHDLSCSLGVPENYEHKTFLSACEKILSKARKANVGAGIHFWGDNNQQRRFLNMGANMLIHSADITLFQKALSNDINAIRGFDKTEDVNPESRNINI